MSQVPERPAPAVSWRAVAAGAALALVVSLLVAAPAAIVAVPAGGFLAGRIAGTAGLLQGTVVAVLFIVLHGAVTSFGPAPTVELVADTVATVGWDALLLALGAAGGALATRS